MLDAFFAHEKRFFLTGGGALAGYYVGHRDTEDLDLFGAPTFDADDAVHALQSAVRSLGATMEALKTYPDFRRFLVRRNEERCVVDVVIDRAPMIDVEKKLFGAVRVDTLREIAANKICALLGRSEIKDLVDLKALVDLGVDLPRALEDARRKDGGAEPATLAWVLDQIRIAPTAALPGGVDPMELLAFRDAFTAKLRAAAFERASQQKS